MSSPYSRVFDDSNTNWKSDKPFNHVFIQAQQNYMNYRLKVHGYVFLNEVYEALGFTRTRVGQIVGWLVDGNGDGFIDFGLNEKEFKNGGVLDFNVDGIIYDKIKEETTT